MTRDEFIPSQMASRTIAEVGGPVDEVRLTLGIHGPELQPEVISALLGCAPTSAHLRGDTRGPSGLPYREGAWLLTVEGGAPPIPDDLVGQLAGRLPTEPAVWQRLAEEYTVRVRFGVFVGAWNRGFELSPISLKQLTVFGVPIGFDIYCDEGD